jgi:hypothetical protein
VSIEAGPVRRYADSGQTEAARRRREAVQYLLLIYDDEKGSQTTSDQDRKSMMDAYYGYTDEIEKAGVSRASEALQPTASATTVRVRNGERLLTDGPFAETKEQLGGFYLIECDTLDEAIEWAGKIPSVTSGSIEVRPVMQFPPRDQR